jgi:hypothetical protein
LRNSRTQAAPGSQVLPTWQLWRTHHLVGSPASSKTYSSPHMGFAHCRPTGPPPA